MRGGYFTLSIRNLHYGDIFAWPSLFAALELDGWLFVKLAQDFNKAIHPHIFIKERMLLHT